MNDYTKPLWRVPQVAKYLRLKPRTIYNKVSRGEIPSHKVGGTLYFLRDEIENYILEN